MERYRCISYKSLVARFDQRISNIEKAEESKREGTARRKWADAEQAKINQARALARHLARCPLCR